MSDQNADNAISQRNNENTASNEEEPQPQAAPAQSGWQIFKSVAGRMLFMYCAMQAMNYFKSRPVGAPNQVQRSDPVSNSVAPHLGQPGNMFDKGTLFDMFIYISESEKFEEFENPKSLFWNMNDIEYGNWNFGENQDGIVEMRNQIELSERMKNNGSIYLHTYFTEAGRSPNPKDKDTYSKRRTFSTFKRLNKYAKKVYKTTKNLLTGDTEKDEDYQLKAKDKVVEILSHWHPNITINLVDDHTPWQKNSVPPPLNEFVEFDKVTGKYYPILFLNDYWNLHEDYMPINDTLTHVNLSLTFSHLQLWKWQLYLSQSQQVKNSWYNGMLAEDSNDEDQDTIKRTLLETNPYLLVLTALITLVHNVFEFLAFKNDIQFWKNKKSLEGLSINSVLFGCFTQLIVLLYVLDNQTNTVVIISVGIGLCIDLWKVPKVLNVTVDYENKWFGLIPRVKMAHKTSYVTSNTNDYDKLAFKYLSWVLFPLVVGYAVYSLIYHEHKGWYSWLLSMIYGFLLTFGFIMMTPQLFINYKMKSVAHLPWRMMTYKALNTFIDDIFAFVVKMPTMYRIGCFRDDIIFFINLYQRWIYKIDKKRVNEFGTSGETPEEHEARMAAAGTIEPVDDPNSVHPKSE